MRGWTLAVALLLLAVAAVGVACRSDQRSAAQMRERIAALEQERRELSTRIDRLVASDRRLEGMPGTQVRFGVPTPLARTLITRVISGFVDQVTLVLEDIRVRKRGRVKKVITIGEYDLEVNIDEVVGRLHTGPPEVRFGGDQVSVELPIEIASGSGDATIHFVWDGRNISGAVCGDMDVTETVGGDVKPETYQVVGGLELTANTQQILAEPRFPPIRVKIKVEPSEESWEKVRAILESRGGLCGYVVEKVDIPGILAKLVGRGFNVRLPTEKIKPMAVPVGIEPNVTIAGRDVTLGVKNVDLAITEHVIWLGADVDVTVDSRASTEADPASHGVAVPDNGHSPLTSKRSSDLARAAATPEVHPRVQRAPASPPRGEIRLSRAVWWPPRRPPHLMPDCLTCPGCM